MICPPLTVLGNTHCQSPRSIRFEMLRAYREGVVRNITKPQGTSAARAKAPKARISSHMLPGESTSRAKLSEVPYRARIATTNAREDWDLRACRYHQINLSSATDD
jgi:hypothetical protein